MAQPEQQRNSITGYSRLGIFVRRAVKVSLIVLLAFQPGFAGGGGGGGKGGKKGGCGSGGGGSAPPGTPPGFSGGSAANYVSTELRASYSSSGAAPTIAAATYAQTLNGEDYIAKLLSESAGKFDARLPGYSYFQGVLQAENHITMVGQVRVVGAVLGADALDATANLYQGAMITSNAHGFVGGNLVTPSGGMRTRIMELEEIPNP